MRIPLPIQLTPRQNKFCTIAGEEGLFGGAAGGGKSDGLLAWLAEGVHLRDYGGIIFRRTFTHHVGREGLIDKAYKIYGPMGGKFNWQTKSWKFPSGATIEHGHLPEPKSAEKIYQGRAWHRAAYDELTHFLEDQYLYIQGSRLREEVGFPIPCAVRASANPGGEGHAWVKKRFITKESMRAIRRLKKDEPTPLDMVFWSAPSRFFVPSRLPDNQHVDRKQYRKRLAHLPKIMREQLENGDWSTIEGAIIPYEQLNFYNERKAIIRLLDKEGKVMEGTGQHPSLIHEENCLRFCTIDTAGTSKQKTRESKGKTRSYSSISVWDYWRSRDVLVLRYVWRDRVSWLKLRKESKNVIRDWNVRIAHIENAHFGPALAEELENDPQLMMDEVSLVGTNLPGMSDVGENAKLDRAVATKLLERIEDGRLRIPFLIPGHEILPELAWVVDWVSEVTEWRGEENEQTDQIDNASVASYVVGDESMEDWGGTIEQ